MIMMSTTTGDSGLIKLLCVRMQLLEFPSSHAHILCPLLSLLLCRFRYTLPSSYGYVIVCFTLDVNCEERERAKGEETEKEIQCPVCACTREEEELTRDKREKEEQSI